MRDHQRLPGLHAGAAADLGASIRWLLLAHDDRDAWIPSDVPHLHVVLAREDVESALTPLMPYGRDEHVVVRTSRGENGEERPL